MIDINKKNLIAKNAYLVRHFASKYYVDDFGINYETLVISGFDGLLEAVGSYNSKSGVKLSTLSSNLIKFKILDAIRKASSFTKEDITQVLNYGEAYLINFRSSSGNNAENFNYDLINIDTNFKNKCLVVYSAYLKEYLFNSKLLSVNDMMLFFDLSINKLCSLEQKILYMYYTEGFNYFQIKSLLDIPEDNIFFIHTLALAKLREYFLSISDNKQ